MTAPNTENLWLRRVKWLTQALIISGALNIGLLATFIYFVLKDKHESLSYENRSGARSRKSETPSQSNQELLRAYSSLSFQELLLRLENKDLAEEGYTKRDLALATLVAFHHFNLERALGGLGVQQRYITFTHSDEEGQVDLTIFPGLADYQYQAIMHYARTEKWPFTSQGLFYEIKRSTLSRDPSLVDAFTLSPEFHSVFTLFSRTGTPVDKETVVTMLADAEWKPLSDFAQEQRVSQDVSPERRRSLLLAYINYKSKTAATLLLKTDPEFVVKRLDDARLLVLLDLLPLNTPHLGALSKHLLSSPRSDWVLRKAASKLYALSGRAMPEPYDHAATCRLFLQRSSAPIAAAAPKPLQPLTSQPTKPAPARKNSRTPSPEPLSSTTTLSRTPPAKTSKTSSKPSRGRRTHIVQEGETLWKIARQYHTSVDSIVQANRLSSEHLRPGLSLSIP